MKVQVFYLFSKNKKIGSQVIAWASGLIVKDLAEVPSHVAVMVRFEDLGEDIVIESVLDAGVRLAPYSQWKKRNIELYQIACTQGPRSKEDVFEVINKMWGRQYDWAGIGFFAWFFILHFLFKVRFPTVNRWESSDKFFCTEAAAIISGYDKPAGMVTPAKMASDFLKMSKGA